MLALALATLAATGPPLDVDRIAPCCTEPGRTRLVVTDRRSGRRTVLARGLRRGLRGSVVGGYWASGRRVAYVKERTGRRWAVARLHVVRVGRRRVNRLETLRLFRARPRIDRPLDVVMTSRGALAWLSPRGVVLRRPGRRPRLLTPKRHRSVALEDDSTLRLDGTTYIDLRPFPGCGGRSRFRTVFENAEVLVSRAFYDSIDELRVVLRACRQADGRDPVVARTLDYFPDGTAVDVGGADRDWVLILSTSCDRYGDGCSTGIRAAQAGSGRQGPGAGFSSYVGQHWLPFGGEVAVAETGVSAWVSQGTTEHRLVAIPQARVHRVLDSGPPGSIAGLAFDGATLHWTHDGAPRSEIP